MKFNITVEYDFDEDYRDLNSVIKSEIVEQVSRQLLYQLSGSKFSGEIKDAADGAKRSVSNRVADILKDKIDVASIEKSIANKVSKDIEKNFVDKYTDKIQKNIENDLDKKIKDIVRKDIKQSIGNAFLQ